MKLPLEEDNPLITDNKACTAHVKNLSEPHTCILYLHSLQVIYVHLHNRKQREEGGGGWGEGGGRVAVTGGATDPCHAHQEALDGSAILFQDLPFSDNGIPPPPPPHTHTCMPHTHHLLTHHLLTHVTTAAASLFTRTIVWVW